MRYLFYISTLFLFCMNIQAQNAIPVADPNFLQCLKTNTPQLINGNDELDTIKAKAYNGPLSCFNMDINEVPELIYFDSIISLNLSQNNLTWLPPVDNLKQLTLFYTAENQLTSLPPLDNLKALERLICWKNQLTELPDISMLHNLYRLDVPVNKLTTFPELSPTAPMRTILVDDNFITDLPDLSIYPDLEIVKLVNNQLSFDDLEMILSQPDQSIYDYYPQKFFDVLTHTTVDEGDSLLLVCPIDQNNPDVLVRWMKDGAFLTSEGDTLLIYPLDTTHSGQYIAQTSSNLFPNKPLYTNMVTIDVRECPLLEEVNYTVSHAQCTQPGKVTVNTTEAYTFELTGATTLVPNEVHVFKGVEAGTYQLVAKHPSGCERIAGTIELESKVCEEVIITPDGDGYQDSFYFDYEGQGTIYDKFGNKVTTFSLPASWDATKAKKKVAPGYYTLDVNDGTTLVGITIVY